MNIEDVKLFLGQFKTCVLATCSNAQPQAATVGYSADSEVKIMIATTSKTRKAMNLAKNNKVALVVGFDGPKTVQLEGVAKKLSQQDYKKRVELHFQKVPGAKKFAGDDGQNYYLITPTWLRLTDYTKIPSIFETRDFS